MKTVIVANAKSQSRGSVYRFESESSFLLPLFSVTDNEHKERTERQTDVEHLVYFVTEEKDANTHREIEER